VTTASTSALDPRPSETAPTDVAVAEADADGEGGRRAPRLHHEPALDGLRGIAVAAVVVFHLDRLEGGFLGVDLFFVLSGFLITSLLLAEHHRGGTIRLGRFWERRARRLLPALFVMLLGVAVLLATLATDTERVRVRGDALATLGYVANWHRMVSEFGYWDMFGMPSPLDHTWSLAIEEQFYVLWPLVAALVLGLGVRSLAGPIAGPKVRRLGLLALAGAAVSFALLALTWVVTDTNRAYYATDTRIGPTLLGAALAAFVAGRPRRTGPPARWIEAAAIAALGWMAVCTTAIDGQGFSYYRGGLLSFSICAVAVIFAFTGGPLGPVGRAVAWRPLRWLGTVSYGVYLWHWPVIVFLTEERAHVGGWALDGLRVAVTLAVSALSFRYVESRIRHGALPGRRLLVAGGGALAVTLVAVLAATWGTVPATGAGPDRVPVRGSNNPNYLYPSDIAPGATRLLLIGDSGVGHLGPGLVSEADPDRVAVASNSQIVCTVVDPEGETRTPEGEIVRNEPCHEDARDRWDDLVDEFRPDVVVYYLANAGGVADVHIDGQWVTDCDPAYDRYLARAVRRDLDLLGQHGARVVIASTPYPGALFLETRPKVDCRNATYRRIVEQRPGTEIVDLNGFVERQRADDVQLYEDAIHFSPSGARRVADWLIPEVLGADVGADAAADASAEENRSDGVS
jgi:peptidoglycan/LPS O-acetylase OafA/YrhL